MIVFLIFSLLCNWTRYLLPYFLFLVSIFRFNQSTSANIVILISPCKGPWCRHKHEHKAQNFPFSCVCAASSKNEIPLRHNTSARIFTTRGYVKPLKTLDLDYLASKPFSKMPEGSAGMILLVLVFGSNFVLTWVIPIAYVRAFAWAYGASETTF